jgi:hypothetical protein
MTQHVYAILVCLSLVLGISHANADDVIQTCAKYNGNAYLIGEDFKRQACRETEVLVEWLGGFALELRIEALEVENALLRARIETLEQRRGQYVGSLPARDGGFGVPSADAECNTAFSGSRPCTESELMLALMRDLLPAGSWWRLNRTREDQCYESFSRFSPWSATQSQTGGPTLTVFSDGRSSIAREVGCNTTHQVACCQQ